MSLSSIVSIAFVSFALIASVMSAEQSSDDGKMAKLAEHLDAAPSWFLMTDKTISIKGEKLINACKEVLSKLKKSEISDFVSYYMKKKKDILPIERWSRIYIFNRIATNVPEWDYFPEKHQFGSWGGITDKSGKVNVLFPLKIHRGKFIIYETPGPYMGPSYRGVEEFALFVRRYGYRKTFKNPS